MRKEKHKEFVSLRNQIMHFKIPEKELSLKTLEFICKVVQPVVCNFQKINLLEYARIYDEEIEEYIFEQINRI